MVIIYGGTYTQVMEQMTCDHDWHGPCMDEISRYNKCTKCLCLGRDCVDEQDYYRLQQEAIDNR